MTRCYFLALLLASIVGCSGLVVDPSIQAVEAGDLTLAMSACEAVPSGGMDLCRVREGQVIDSSWRMVVPHGGAVIGGEVDVYYRDLHRSYAVTGAIVEIPWKDFFGQPVWSRAMDGEALALVLIRYRTPQGVEEIVKLRGIAKIMVLKDGYDRLPIDSGFAAWKTKCTVAYSTAGRGALRCQ